MKYSVTIEALKRATVEVEASDQGHAFKKVQDQLMNEGVTGIEFDEMFDSIKVTNVQEINE